MRLLIAVSEAHHSNTCTDIYVFSWNQFKKLSLLGKWHIWTALTLTHLCTKATNLPMPTCVPGALLCCRRHCHQQEEWHMQAGIQWLLLWCHLSPAAWHSPHCSSFPSYKQGLGLASECFSKLEVNLLSNTCKFKAHFFSWFRPVKLSSSVGEELQAHWSPC